MLILPALATQFQSLFPRSEHDQERARWFALTLQAILLPITDSRTSNLLRTIATLFGVGLGRGFGDSFLHFVTNQAQKAPKSKNTCCVNSPTLYFKLFAMIRVDTNGWPERSDRDTPSRRSPPGCLTHDPYRDPRN